MKVCFPFDSNTAILPSAMYKYEQAPYKRMVESTDNLSLPSESLIEKVTFFLFSVFLLI